MLINLTVFVIETYISYRILLNLIYFILSLK